MPRTAPGVHTPGATKVLEFSGAATRDERKQIAHEKAKDMAAKWVYDARTEAGLTQAELGTLIGVTGARISQLESLEHRAPVSLEILCQISRALHMPLIFKSRSLKRAARHLPVKQLG